MLSSQKTSLATIIACGGRKGIEDKLAALPKLLRECSYSPAEVESLTAEAREFVDKILPLYKGKYDGFNPPAVQKLCK